MITSMTRSPNRYLEPRKLSGGVSADKPGCVVGRGGPARPEARERRPWKPSSSTLHPERWAFRTAPPPWGSARQTCRGASPQAPPHQPLSQSRSFWGAQTLITYLVSLVTGHERLELSLDPRYWVARVRERTTPGIRSSSYPFSAYPVATGHRKTALCPGPSNVSFSQVAPLVCLATGREVAVRNE